MSGYFGRFKQVKTRKAHQCITCGRRIPVGKQAYHESGMWEGDWQNWYMCMPCLKNDVCGGEEEIGGDEFNEWLYEQDEMACPSCRDKYNRYDTEWEWDDKEENVEFECTECGHKWSMHIGFDKGVRE